MLKVFPIGSVVRDSKLESTLNIQLHITASTHGVAMHPRLKVAAGRSFSGAFNLSSYMRQQYPHGDVDAIPHLSPRSLAPETCRPCMGGLTMLVPDTRS